MIKQNTTRRHFLIGLAISTAISAIQLSSFAADTTSSQETILFLGDSITAGGEYVRIIDAALKKQNPDNPPCIINRGKKSETISGLSEACHPGVRPCLFTRLDKELESQKPDWVVACYGINCGIYHPFDENRFKAYKTGINKLIKKVHASGIPIIFLTSPPYANPGPAFPKDIDAANQEELLREANKNALAEAENSPNRYGYRTPYAYYDHVLEIYASWVMTLNDEENVWVIDLRKTMLPRLKKTHGKDPVHPNKFGHKIMANSFLEEWQRIEREAEAKKQAASQNISSEQSPAYNPKKYNKQIKIRSQQ